jgi:aminopeptidase N
MLCLGLSLPLAGQSASFSQAGRPERKPWSADRLAAFSQDRADSLTGFDVQKYEITLSINDQSHVITGNVLATVLAEQSLSSLQYELRSLTVSSVLVNGSPAAYTHTNGVITISLNIPAGQTFTTQVFYSGVPQLTSDIYHIGMIFSANTVFTISDPDAARQWWPCYDHPWDKALVDLHITMRSDWKVAANGLRDGITDHGNGSSTTHWLGQHPMTTYLVCVTAGPYVEIPQTAGTLPIQNFVMQNQYNNALIDFQHLPDMIQYFSPVFGPYPFEKYGQTVVSMSTYGAMEHQTMTTLGNYIITGNGIYEVVIAHELAHQWYGNAVSFLTFKDVWLSEGFATYSEHLWTDKRFGWDSACAYVGSSYHQYYNNWENSAGPQTIYNPSFNNYFAPPSYEKAASVLHMLRLKIGNANFFALLNQWFTAHMHGNVITSEFQALAEQISGQDLDQFFNQWIFGSGIPSLEYSIWNNDMSDSPGKIIARSTSPTATSFQIEVPFRVTSERDQRFPLCGSRAGLDSQPLFPELASGPERDRQPQPLDPSTPDHRDSAPAHGMPAFQQLRAAGMAELYGRPQPQIQYLSQSGWKPSLDTREPYSHPRAQLFRHWGSERRNLPVLYCRAGSGWLAEYLFTLDERHS